MDGFTSRAFDANFWGNDRAVRRELQSISIRVYSQPARYSAWATAGPFVVRIFEGSDQAGCSGDRDGIEVWSASGVTAPDVRAALASLWPALATSSYPSVHLVPTEAFPYR